MEEDKEDLESKFQSLIESQSVAHEAFKKEMDAINSQIEALEEQKQKIADKYGFPYKCIHAHAPGFLLYSNTFLLAL